MSRNFSLPAQDVMNSFCDYPCSVVYDCIPGYISVLGPTYTATCNENGEMIPPEVCVPSM